jgi:hypothetical protein
VCGSWVGDDGIGFVECDGATLYKWMGVVQGGICGTSIIMAQSYSVQYIYSKEDSELDRL